MFHRLDFLPHSKTANNQKMNNKDIQIGRNKEKDSEKNKKKNKRRDRRKDRERNKKRG